MNPSFSFNLHSHRLAKSKLLQKEFNSLLSRYQKIDPSFSTILTKAQMDPALDLVIKCVLSKNLFSANFQDKEERIAFSKEVSVLLDHPNKKLADYLLVYEDLAYFFTNRGEIANIGRGSSVSSYLCYLLGITKINPLKFNLISERFLNQDIYQPVIDFECANREEAVDYLKEKYHGSFFCIATELTHSLNSAFSYSLDSLQIKLNKNKEKTIRDLFREFIGNQKPCTYQELYQKALTENSLIKLFFELNPDLEKAVRLTIGTFKAFSSHPCNFVLTNKSQNLPAIAIHNGNIKEKSLKSIDHFLVTVLSNVAYQDLKNLYASSDNLKKVNFNKAKVFDRITKQADSRINESFLKEYHNYVRDEGSLILKSIEDICLIRSNENGNVKPDQADAKKIAKEFKFEDILKQTKGKLIFQEDLVEIIKRNSKLSLSQSFIFFMKLSKGTLTEKEKEVFRTQAGDLESKLYLLLSSASQWSMSKSHMMGVSHLTYLTSHYSAKINYEL